MMPITFDVTRRSPEDVDVVGVPVFSDRLGPDEALAPSLEPDWAFLAHQGFEGKAGEVQALPGDGDGGPPLLAVGMGASGEVDARAIRRAGAALARAASRHQRIATTLLEAAGPDVPPAVAAQALAEGIVLASYRFDRYKSDPKPMLLSHVTVIGTGGRKLVAALERGSLIAEAVCFARDLVNEPGGSLTPRALAQHAFDLAEREGLRISVLDEVDVEAARLGGLLGVNRGSTEPPRFIELAYEPERPRGSVAIVGKGITFDSGGLSLKPADGMMKMKDDMGGAAAVLATMSVIRQVAPRVKVTGYVPATDNMPGGDAMRPGDVLTIRNGKTVEVLNTDAEGRLVLADALSLASEAEPDAIVDLATLTGACVVALGEKVAGLMGNHDGWIDQVQAAADRAGEAVWPLPLPKAYRESIDSPIADLKNISNGRYGGALVAGLFLQEFVGEGIPWVHLDIAGPAESDNDDGEITKGGTGFGVRTLLELLARFSRP
jgi:leucyl aminopeptidase